MRELVPKDNYGIFADSNDTARMATRTQRHTIQAILMKKNIRQLTEIMMKIDNKRYRICRRCKEVWNVSGKIKGDKQYICPICEYGEKWIKRICMRCYYGKEIT